jgi:hypothetical protein
MKDLSARPESSAGSADAVAPSFGGEQPDSGRSRAVEELVEELNESEESLEPVTAGVPAAARSAEESRPVEAVASEAVPDIAPSPPVKTVKVRSTIDVMAELEALRKRATSSSPKAKKESPAAAGGSMSRLGREIQKALNFTVPPDTIGRASAMRVTVSFENGEEVVQQQTDRVELGDTADVHAVSVNVRIDQT